MVETYKTMIINKIHLRMILIKNIIEIRYFTNILILNKIKNKKLLGICKYFADRKQFLCIRNSMEVTESNIALMDFNGNLIHEILIEKGILKIFKCDATHIIVLTENTIEKWDYANNKKIKVVDHEPVLYGFSVFDGREYTYKKQYNKSFFVSGIATNSFVLVINSESTLICYDFNLNFLDSYTLNFDIKIEYDFQLFQTNGNVVLHKFE